MRRRPLPPVLPASCPLYFQILAVFLMKNGMHGTKIVQFGAMHGQKFKMTRNGLKAFSFSMESCTVIAKFVFHWA